MEVVKIESLALKAKKEGLIEGFPFFSIKSRSRKFRPKESLVAHLIQLHFASIGPINDTGVRNHKG
jgi:hypothetical protein